MFRARIIGVDMELSDLIEGRFLRRVNRFIAEAQLADGTIVKAHLANTCLLYTSDAADD